MTITFRGLRVLVLILSLLFTATPKKTIADEPVLRDQIITDLVSAGVTIGASLSGNVALALSAGYLTKYITTYGIAGVKKLISTMKGNPPRDLGEVNLYYVYLLNIKRNLYFSLINIRKASRFLEGGERIEAKLRELAAEIVGNCKEGCELEGLDIGLVNHSIVNIALDAPETIALNDELTVHEIKSTYQYLMMLYLDIVLVEQQLIEAQYDVLASSTANIKAELDKNPFLSQEEKEYQYNIAYNIAFRWMKMRDERKLIISNKFETLIARLNGENIELENDIDGYRDRFNKNKKGKTDYQGQLDDVIGDMEDFGIRVNVFNQNPFQTGTALRNYYLAEKTLLLERDTLFQLKANRLKTTEDIADYHHRIRVLRTHGNNIFLQLLEAMKKFQESEGNETGINYEEPKHRATLEEILKECDMDEACVTDRLNNPETNVTNILVDNFELSSEIFKDAPLLQSIELNSIYQLVQLIYLECLYAQLRVSRIEFEIFLNKQRTLFKVIDTSHTLSPIDREMNKVSIKNLINKWKLKILERKYDSKNEFLALATEYRNKNLDVKIDWLKTHDSLPKNARMPKCSTRWFNSDRKRCKTRKAFMKSLHSFKENQLFNTNHEQKLPQYFWAKL